MTTITIEQNIDIGKTHFKDVLEFAKYLSGNFDEFGLYEVEKEFLTDELVEKANICRAKDESELINI